MSFDFKATADTFAQQTQALASELDRDRREAELAATLKPYEPNEMWAFAPQSVKDDARRKAEAALDERAGRALFHAQSALHHNGPALDTAIERAKEAPNPEAAWALRTGRIGLASTDYLLTGVLAELCGQRVASETAGMLPTQVLSLYRRALEDPTEQSNATTIRIIEARFQQTWRGATFDTANDGELVAHRELSNEIRTRRDARVPADALAATESREELRRYEQRARDLYKLRPVRP